MAKAVSYGGRKACDLRDEMAAMSAKYGNGPVALAFSDVTMTDPATGLTVLKPEARRACRVLLGPPPESEEYSTYWRRQGCEPPAAHRPPAPKEPDPVPEEEPAASPAQSVTVRALSPTPAVSAAPSDPPWRREPSDEVLAAYERLEGWLRDGGGKPVDDEAEATLYMIARALLDVPPKKSWFQAVDARLQAMQVDPPEYVKNGDLMAFDETLDDLLDHLHEVMLVPRPGQAR